MPGGYPWTLHRLRTYTARRTGARLTVIRVPVYRHRPPPGLAGDGEVSAKRSRCWLGATKSMVWSGRQTSLLRSTLREFCPAALAAFDNLAHPDALEVLRVAPTPSLGAGLSRSKIAAALRAVGANGALTSERPTSKPPCALQLQAPAAVANAMGASVAASVAVIAEMAAQEAHLATELSSSFEQHADAQVVRSLPGLGTHFGARVLGEFGDEPDAMSALVSQKLRRHVAHYRASAPRRPCSRHVRNRRLADAIYLWAFAALTASPGARAFYDQHPAPATAMVEPCEPSATVSSASCTAAWA